MSDLSRSAKRLLARGSFILAAATLFVTPARAAGPSSSPAGVAGRYAMLRAGDKDTGCMLTLDGTKRGPGGFKALLAPACRDQGLVIFDPVGWAIERGRLVLTARQGHKARFDQQTDGVWRRDAKEGKALALKRI